MSGDLGNLLTGELGEAEARFSHEDFAGLYGRRIAGRVRRRRAVRAAGVGGGTMLTAGALVVGVTQVPWGTLGATPGVGASDCATPSATDGWQAHSASIDTSEATSGEVVFTDNASGSTILRGVQQPDGTYLFTDGQGKPLSATPGVGGYYTVELPPGAYYDPVIRSISLEPGGAGSVSSQQATSTPSAATGSYIYEVTVVPGVVPDATVRLTDPANGTTILWATLQPDGSYYFADMYGIQADATLEATGQYLVTVPQGLPISSGGAPDPGAGEILVNSIRSVGVEAPDGSASPSASDDCYTAEPTSSGDETASAEPSPSADPSVAAKPEDVAESPFQCGFEFPTESYSTETQSIGALEWVSPDEINAQIKASHPDSGSEIYQAAGQGAVPVVTVTDSFASSFDEWATGGGDAIDPMQMLGERDPDALPSGVKITHGSSFVAVTNGVVVGTIEDPFSPAATPPVYQRILGNDFDQSLALLNADSAFTACPGATLDGDWDVYAIAGDVARESNGTLHGPDYVWLKVGKP